MPHSPTINATRLRGSYLSMIAACCVIISSTASACASRGTTALHRSPSPGPSRPTTRPACSDAGRGRRSSARLAHHDFGPVVVVVAWTEGDFGTGARCRIRQIGLITLQLVGVVLRPHVAAASPRLVANSPESNVERRVLPSSGADRPSGSSQDDSRTPTSRASPVRCRCRRCRRCRARRREPSQREVLVRPNAVVLRTPPQFVLTMLRRSRGPDAIAPVIRVGKAASRPTDDGHLDRFQCLHDVLAHLPPTLTRRPRPGRRRRSAVQGVRRIGRRCGG